MTVTSSVQDVSYDTDGSTVDFPIPFYFLNDPDIVIDKISKSSGALSTVVLGTDYTVSGAGNQSGGTASTLSTYPAGFVLHIYRIVPVTQETQYQQNDPFPAKTTEKALDKLTMIAQQQASSIFNSIRYPRAEFTRDGTLPDAADRASKILGFDESGTQTLLPVPPAVGAGDMKNEIWKDGVDYTAGTSTSVTLSRTYGSKANLGSVVMAGAAQSPRTYSLAGNTLAFLDDDGAPAVIPFGVSEIWCTGGTTLSLNAPAEGSVTSDTIADGAVTDSKIDPTSNIAIIIKGIWTLERFGAKGDGVTDDTLKIQDALDSGELDIVASARTYLISAPVALRINALSLRGAGTDRTIFKNVTPLADSIQIVDGMTACAVSGMTVMKTLGAATVAGDGVKTLGSSENCLIQRIRVKGHFNGFVLRGTDFGEIEDCNALQNWGAGFNISNTMGYAPTQWQFRRLLSQQNNAHGFLCASQAGGGANGMILGEWTDLQTFANNGQGLALIGSLASPIFDLRLSRFFLGADNGSELFVETCGSNNRVSGGVCEYASIGTSGPNLATANINTASSVHIGGNEVDFSISDSLVMVTPDAGIDVYHGNVSINNVNIFDAAQNPALSGAGVRMNGGSAVITGGFNSRNKVGIAFAAGVGAIVSGGNYNGNASGATGGSTASSRITGCLPASMNN